MSKKVKILCLLMAATTCVTIFGGCGTKKVTPDNETSSNNQGPYTIKILSQIDPTKPYDAEKDVVKAAVEKKLNVKFVPEFVDVQQYKQKLNLKIASGDVPDIMKIDYADDFLKYAPQGIFYDMTDYLNEKNTPNIMKEVPNDVFKVAEVKGKIYGIPYQQGPGAGYRWNLILRKDYLDSIGEKQPQTLDQYYNDLKKIKAQKPDVIPLGAFTQNIGEQKYANNSFDHIFGAFGVTPGYFYVESGKYMSYDVSPKMKDALAYLQRMYNENLIDKEFASIKETNLKDKLFSGKLFSALCWWSMPNDYDKQIEIVEQRKAGKLGKDEVIKEDRSNDPYKYLSIMGSLTGTDGKAVAPAGAPFAQVVAISAKTKDPKRLMSILDKEHTLDLKMLSIWGIENEDYTEVNGKLQTKKSRLDAKTNTDEKGNYRGWETYNFSTSLKGYPRYVEAQPLRPGISLDIAVNNKYQITDASNYLDSSTKLQKFKDLCTMRDSYFTQIIMGADISKFDEFVTKWKEQGGDAILKEFEISAKDKAGK